MEKFSVDLEKVLDEFEFNEEREEQDTPPAIKNQPLPHLGLCQVAPNRPPAASYRRPSFEPINLLEADFAASPPSITPAHFNNDILKKQNLNKDSCLFLQNGTRNRNCITPPSSSENVLGPNSIVNIKDVLEANQEVRSDEDSWSVAGSQSPTDEKPDLLEYKPNDYIKDVNLPPQLPDVTTSIWSSPIGISSNLDESLKNAPLCDLIHSSNGNLYEHVNHNNGVTHIYNNTQLNPDARNDSKQTDTLLNSDILSDAIKDHLNYTQDLDYIHKGENFTKALAVAIEQHEDKDKGFSQAPSFEDTHRTINNYKEEISGKLNMLHQTIEFQHKNLLSSNNYEISGEDDNRPKSEFSKTSKSYLIKENDNKNADININNFSSNNNLSKVNTNHERKEDLQDIEKDKKIEIIEAKQLKINTAELNKDVDTLTPNTIDSMNNSTIYVPITENELCNKNVDIKPIGFSYNNDVTDGELQQYLDELEVMNDDELCLIAEQSKFSKDITLNDTNILPIVAKNTLTSESFSEINNKPSNLSQNKKGLGKKSSNINRKDKNLDLSMKLSDHISGVGCVSQPIYIDMNSEPSSILVDDNTGLRSFETLEEFEIDSKLNVGVCEVGLTTGHILNENTTSSNNSPGSSSDIQVTTENIGVDGMHKDSENNNSCMEVINKYKDFSSQIVEIKTQTLNNPSSVNAVVDKSEGLLEAEANVDSDLIKCSKFVIESLNKLEKTNDISFNQPSDESNTEHSITEDISGDSENSNSYVEKVIKCKQEFDNVGIHNLSETENIVDCDSLMSQESLEEDSSFNKPLNILNTCIIHSLDSPSPSSNSEYDSVLNVSTKMIPIKTAVECTAQACIDEDGVLAEEDKPLRPNSLELPARITVDTDESTMPLSPATSGELELSPEERRLGKIAPIWVPDSDAPSCMQCQVRFTVIKRRHHCRACGQVLCSKCCSLKARLEFCGYSEVRVCQPCFSVLETVNGTDSQSPLGRQPNPNNPMEYCSTIPPLQQVAGSLHQPPPSVMVPVGVLKREGRSKSDVTKQVMFSDGIRPGGDLTELDGSGEPRIPFRRPGRQTKRVGTPPGGPMTSNSRRALDPITQSFIPKDGETSLPPLVTYSQGELMYTDLEQPITLNEGPFKFAVNRNLNVQIKRVFLDCCVNRECWCISSDGLSCVGQDEVVFLLECLPQETLPPKDVFLLISSLYQNAAKGTTVSEMSFTPASSNKLLGSRDHGGFLYIRPSYQCTAHLILPPPPYLFALLIHRWETPWARLFPIRLVLRLGAEFRYYPCPLVSVRHRAPLYTDIGHTIINLLADFRKYSYTLPTVRGLVIHMEDRQTSILLPRNRYDQVVRALNNSNDSVLAFGANFSLAADSHLVCMQSTEDESTSYHTQAINIHNKPRRVTGASFVVFNGALKTPGLAGKSNIVEDGLMVQVPCETMIALRAALRDMHDYTIGCGPHAEETVLLQWTADDTNFNVGVKSYIDGRPLDGVPSIRVHSGTDYTGSSRLIRWTEVFILQSEEGTDHTGEPLDISRLSGSIAQATCLALVPLLDLLSAASLTTLAVRANIHPENVGYEAGGNGEKLPPFYMKSLDDELVAVVHQAALAAENTPATLELVFRIMEQG